MQQITIKPSDKILIIAPHPDDEVIAVGGFIAKYHNQIDILCPNSSGIKYEWDKKSAEEIAEYRISQFYATAKKAGVNKTYIEKLWGRKVMIDEMEKHFKDYIKHFNIKDYDIVLVPHKNDAHPEHRYVGNVLLKKMMEKQGYKNNLKIFRYELWAPMSNVNHWEDITEYEPIKKDLIYSYGSRGKKYYNRIVALNKYRTLMPFVFDLDKFAEAFYVETPEEYLNKADIVNKKTDKNFTDKTFEKLLKKGNTQEKIDKLAKQLANKKVVLYGAGTFARVLFKNYDLAKLNIIAIADKRFEQDKVHEFYELNCIAPEKLGHFKYDAIIVTNYEYEKFLDILINRLLVKKKNKKLQIYPILG